MEKARILVVEDEEIVAADIRSTLRKLGYEVVASASRGEEAISHAAKYLPDLVLMDVILKGQMNGIEAAEVIRTNYKIPVIYLTAYSDDLTLRRAKITEPYGYVLKPFEDRELSTSIELALYKSQMDRKVRNLEQWLATTLRSIGEGVIAADLTGNITYLNPMAETLSGWNQTTALGHPLHEVFNLKSDSIDFSIQDWMQEVIERSKSVELGEDLVLVTEEGFELAIGANFAPLKDEQGKISGLVVVFRDITYRKYLQAERTRSTQAMLEMQQFLQTTLDAISSHIAVLAGDGTVLLVNASWKRFGQENGAAPDRSDIGGNYLKVCDSATGPFSEGAAAAARGIRAVIEGQQNEFYLEYPCHSSTEKRWFMIRVTPFAEPIPRRIVMAHTNITERKQAETDLAEAYATLEVKVIERTAELEHVKNRLEAIFNNSGDGILLLNLTDGIQQTNFAFDKLFKSTPGATIGLPLRALVHPDNIEKLEAVMQEVAQSHKARQVELVAQPQNKSSFEAEINISPVNFTDKATTSLVCIVRDVSERKQAQRMIAEERNLLRTLIDAIPDYIYVKDNQHRIILNNMAHARSLATKTPEASLGKTDFELFLPEVAAKFYADEVELFRTGRPLLNTEELSVGQDGSNIWALTTKAPLRDLNGEVIGLVGITRDITKIKTQEEALQRNQADLQSIIESSELAFVLLDLESNIRVFNRTAQEYQQQHYGITMVVGRSMLDYIPAGGHPIFLDRLAKVKAGETLNFVNQITTQDKSTYFDFHYYPVKSAGGNVIGVNVAFEDITARKETELQLRFLASLQENMTDAVIATDMQFNIQSWNTAAERIYGWSFEEVRGKSGTELLGTRALSGETDLEIAQVMLAQGYWSGEALHKHRNGNSIFISSSTALLKDTDGRPIGFVGVNRDINERKEAEKARLALTQRLELATFAAGIGIWDWNLKDNQLAWDKQMFEIYGILPENFSETINNWQRTVHHLDYPRIQAEINDAISGETQLNSEFRIIWPTGNIHHLRVTGLVLYDENGAPDRMLGVNLDITNQKLYEETLEQALQQEKELNELKSRFVLIASHEFRTPLATILATTENLKAYWQKMDESQIVKRLNKIKNQVDHLNLIMEDVLLLSRMQAGRLEFSPVETDLDGFCRDIIEELESNPHFQHHFYYSCLFQPLIAQIDHKLMRQILNNLLSNALKYSPEGKSVYFEVFLQGEQFKIKIKDEGIGIPEQDLKHLFEPFHRAGNVSTISGTGLGLTIVKQSIETHGGTIEVESKVGEGTTFTLTIPLF